MWESVRRSYAELITSGTQLLLLLVAIHFESRTAWLYSLSLMALISVFAWLSALKRLRAIRDTPTSKIASAAQGYVELTGRGEQFGDTPLLSPLKLQPCLWYRYKIEVRDSEKDWKTEDSGESSDSFVLNDGSGTCIVDPEQAEISTLHKDCWTIDDHRYTELRLLARDKIYVLGEFRTRSCALEFNSREALNARLTGWKKDMPELLRRFDLNGDGELDGQEWELARQAARREVEKNHREAQSVPDIHIIARPRDKKSFLISNLSPEILSRRYLIWTWIHLAILTGSAAGAGWLLNR